MMEEFPEENVPQTPEEKQAEIDALEELEALDPDSSDELPDDILDLGTRTPEDDEKTNREMLLLSDEIAQIAHAAVVAFQAMAEAENPWPQWSDLSDEERIYRQILIQTEIMPGAANPDSHSFAMYIHDGWMFDKLKESWTWGPEFDEEARTDPRILPYSKLPKVEQWVWVVFRDVCRSFARGQVYAGS